ncbi:MAG: hypothetical protein KAT17_01240 [Candidatus Aminicenantes bacterium]|nr:hypothetical protein [Candidatus Aminicenantes bacterium]
MRIIFLGLLLLSIGSGLSPESQVSISTSDNIASIGDRINIKIIAKTSPEIDKIALETPQQNFEIISQKILAKREFKDYLMFETNLVISFFSTGNFTIGPFTVNMIQNRGIVESKKTNTIEITIKSVLKEKDKDIKDLKNLISLKGNPFYVLKYVILIIALLALGLLLFWVIKKRKQKKEISPLPTLTPLEELESGFKELMEKKYVAKGEIKKFFIQLITIIKQYLNREYGFNAEDMTTTETIFHLQKKEPRETIQKDMDYLFDTSDLVKFAKFIPASRDFKEVDRRVHSIISAQKAKILGETDPQNVSISK